MKRVDGDILFAHIAKQLKALRLGDGTRRLTQTQLASTIGVSRTTITNIETCVQQPTVLQLYALSSALGVPITTLLPDVSAVTPSSVDGVEGQLPPKTAEWVRRTRQPDS